MAYFLKICIFIIERQHQVNMGFIIIDVVRSIIYWYKKRHIPLILIIKIIVTIIVSIITYFNNCTGILCKTFSKLYDLSSVCLYGATAKSAI